MILDMWEIGFEGWKNDVGDWDTFDLVGMVLMYGYTSLQAIYGLEI